MANPVVNPTQTHARQDEIFPLRGRNVLPGRLNQPVRPTRAKIGQATHPPQPGWIALATHAPDLATHPGVGRRAGSMSRQSDPPRPRWVGRLTNLGPGGSHGLVESSREHFFGVPQASIPCKISSRRSPKVSPESLEACRRPTRRPVWVARVG